MTSLLEPLGFQRAVLDEFPFHFIADSRAQLMSAGPALLRLLGRSVLEGTVSSTFDATPPDLEAMTQSVRWQQQTVQLRCKNSSRTVLQGQLLHDPERNLIVFLGWPQLTSAHELQQHGLTVQDVPPSHPLALALAEDSQLDAKVALQRQTALSARHHEALFRLATMSDPSWQTRLQTLLRTDAEVLQVARVSYWDICQPTTICCNSLYRADADAFDSGAKLLACDFPDYFRALNSGELIVAEDAHLHPATREFSESYLRPAGIGAMLDVPVYVDGQLVGVVCHEHVGGARAWAVVEQQFAMSIGQLLSQAIASEQRYRAEEALRRSEARFRAIAQVSPIPLIVNRLDGTCVWANEAAAISAGVPMAELGNRPAASFYANPDERASVLEEFRRDGVVAGREVQLRRADGTLYWTKISIRPFPLDDEQALIVGITDLTDQKRLEDSLRHAALHDPLTGLPNRSMMLELLRGEISRARRDPAHRFVVLFLDLNSFKEVNDTLGHDAGDRILITVAERLRQCLREVDIAARMGGDEFAVLLTGLDRDQAAGIEARIQAALSTPLMMNTTAVPIGASIGVALGDASSTDPGSVLREADLAMYARKRSGRGTKPP